MDPILPTTFSLIVGLFPNLATLPAVFGALSMGTFSWVFWVWTTLAAISPSTTATVTFFETYVGWFFPTTFKGFFYRWVMLNRASSMIRGVREKFTLPDSVPGWILDQMADGAGWTCDKINDVILTVAVKGVFGDWSDTVTESSHGKLLTYVVWFLTSRWLWVTFLLLFLVAQGRGALDYGLLRLQGKSPSVKPNVLTRMVVYFFLIIVPWLFNIFIVSPLAVPMFVSRQVIGALFYEKALTMVARAKEVAREVNRDPKQAPLVTRLNEQIKNVTGTLEAILKRWKDFYSTEQAAQATLNGSLLLQQDMYTMGTLSGGCRCFSVNSPLDNATVLPYGLRMAFPCEPLRDGIDPNDGPIRFYIESKGTVSEEYGELDPILLGVLKFNGKAAFEPVLPQQVTSAPTVTAEMIAKMVAQQFAALQAEKHSKRPRQHSSAASAASATASAPNDDASSSSSDDARSVASSHASSSRVSRAPSVTSNRSHRSKQETASTAPTTVDTAQPTDGLPLYNGQMCWLATIAWLIRQAFNRCARDSNSVSAHMLARDRSLFHERAVSELLPFVDKALHGKIAAVYDHFERVARHCRLYKGNDDKSTIADVVEWGQSLPKPDIVPIAVAVFDEKKEHWFAATRQQGKWVIHDSNDKIVNTMPRYDFAVWAKRRGGAPRAAPKPASKPVPSRTVKTSRSASAKPRDSPAAKPAAKAVPKSAPNVAMKTAPKVATKPAPKNTAQLSTSASSSRTASPAEGKANTNRGRPRLNEIRRDPDVKEIPITAASIPVALTDVSSIFRCGQGTIPPLAALKGDALINLTLAAKQRIPTMAEDGLTPEVRMLHLRMLQKLKSEEDGIPKELFPLPLTEALIRWIGLAFIKANKKWTHSTIFRYMTAIAGAFSNLPAYSNSPIGFTLGDCSTWRAAIRKAELDKNEFQPTEAPATCFPQVCLAIEATPDKEARCALMLTWSCAGRVSDVLRLKTKNVEFDATSGKMRVLFAEGKGARFSQPYTVPTLIPIVWRPELEEFLKAAAARSGLPLFRQQRAFLGTTITRALRAADPALGQRALRRGALQAMADSGVDEATLMIFSGHRRPATLHRYLGWARHGSLRQDKATAAAEHLDSGEQAF